MQVLRRETQLALGEIEDILWQLRDVKWVVRTAAQGWVLARNAGDIMAADVFRLFVFEPETAQASENDALLRAQTERLAASLGETLAGSLQDLCASSEPA